MNTDPTYPIELITSYFAGEASPDDLVFLEAWLKADPAHREFFESCNKTWLILEKDKVESRINLDHEWHEIKKKADLSSSGKFVHLPVEVEERGTRRLFYTRLVRIAALILLFVVPTTFIYLYFAKPEMKVVTAEVALLESRLPDGSAVTLNTGSSIEYPVNFKKHERDIKLTGEAYFEVSHDKTRPFIITAGDVRIEVLGTSFYVNTEAANGKVEVILANGKVAVYYSDKESGKVILAPGEKVDVSIDQQEIVKTGNDDQNFLSWKTRKLVFTNQPLSEIVSTLNKVYHAQVRIAQPALASCRVTATFDNQSLGSVLSVLSATLNLKVTQNSNWTEISGENCTR